MAAYRRREVKSDIEKSILIGMIIDTDFLRDVLQYLDKDYFQISYSKVLIQWIKSYYEKYKMAPGLSIQDIYMVEKYKLDEADAKLIETFLLDLSSKYGGEKTKFNGELLLDQSIEYFKERALAITADEVSVLVRAGKPEEAEKVVTGYRQISKKMSKWVEPFDSNYIAKVFEKKFEVANDEDREDYLFKFPGILGEFMGPFERGWLISFMGPMKRGKTFFLQEAAVQALINRLNVVFISLEMDSYSLSGRFYKRISALGDYEKDEFVYPCFDCQKNQEDTCVLPERKNRVRLLDGEGNKPFFDPSFPYSVCTACRKNGSKKSQYIAATWFEILKVPKMNFKRMKREVNNFSYMYGKQRLKIISYPAYSASIENIKYDLDNLEYTDDFIPDVIIVDYADILAPESGSKKFDVRGRIDETWKMLKQLAAMKHCIVITASQSTRKTLQKKNVMSTDTAEDIRKLAHVDAMYSLNQSEYEKKQGIMRIGTVVHRWMSFSETKHVMVLQNLKIGQVVLDSEYVSERKRDGDEE